METISPAEILEELRLMNKKLDYIQEHMIEVMSEEDEQLLEEALRAHIEGKTITLDELEKDVQS